MAAGRAGCAGGNERDVYGLPVGGNRDIADRFTTGNSVSVSLPGVVPASNWNRVLPEPGLHVKVTAVEARVLLGVGDVIWPGELGASVRNEK